MTHKQQFPDTMTLGEAREYLRNNYEAGVICPCCTGFTKLYIRSITSAMAIGLITLYNKRKTQWTHLEDFFKEQPNLPSSIRGDLPKLRFWNLIKAHPEKEGVYCITTCGEDFVNKEYVVPPKVRIYNNKSYGFTGKDVTIVECLKNKFDYDKLMRG